MGFDNHVLFIRSRRLRVLRYLCLLPDWVGSAFLCLLSNAASTHLYKYFLVSVARTCLCCITFSLMALNLVRAAGFLLRAGCRAGKDKELKTDQMESISSSQGKKRSKLILNKQCTIYHSGRSFIARPFRLKSGSRRAGLVCMLDVDARPVNREDARFLRVRHHLNTPYGQYLARELPAGGQSHTCPPCSVILSPFYARGTQVAPVVLFRSLSFSRFPATNQAH